MSLMSSVSPALPSPKYPHVVVRLIPAVYQRVRLIFGAEGRATSQGIYIPDVLPRTAETGEELHDDERTIVVRTVQAIVDLSTLRMCVVFGANDCVFLTRNAPPVTSDMPPSGGVQFLPKDAPPPPSSPQTRPVTRADFSPTGVAILAQPGDAGPSRLIGEAKTALVVGVHDAADAQTPTAAATGDVAEPPLTIVAAFPTNGDN
jgi:hypothetical protein